MCDIADEDNCVDFCPIRGHAPLCSKKECYEARLNDYKGCYEVLEISFKDINDIFS